MTKCDETWHTLVTYTQQSPWKVSTNSEALCNTIFKIKSGKTRQRLRTSRCGCQRVRRIPYCGKWRCFWQKFSNGLKEHTAYVYHYDGQSGTSKTFIRSLLNTRRHIPKEAVLHSYRQDNPSLQFFMFSEYSHTWITSASASWRQSALNMDTRHTELQLCE